MPNAARLTDLHVCPMLTPGTPPIPHVGGPVIAPGAAVVLIEGLPAARVTDLAFCAAPLPDMIATGSATVFIQGLPAARVGDQTIHGGVIVSGAGTVQIGA
ncbi:PAAR domain-containing protein [Noviherbaspirillum sp.]|uniref:PAAR domain-containing protein n=1 Tax=Noviherbaspirillum sp. TaxID=1926288 RepID=UPI002FE30C78